ncbi:DUF192 domain-containing protein [Halorhabdus sp. CBA1104]|uniref:DUF192 domain-containing protein n=1 Tax=unclassified Halorhabdus TaxID=2621901 RepID=UPI0012B3FAF3|nr:MULTISPECIES: DUF192 domain-containing protein [unclassified Halorhabdus]QGN06164.1 DUF192 domain-containing protein [Halorhabdus sp. CBA1104]
MRVVHDPSDGTERRTLATDVHVADGFWAKFRGLRGRSSIPADFALVFPFEAVGRRDIDMVFVRTPIDVVWVRDGDVQQVSTLRSWIGFGLAKADCVIELPPGGADDVEVGDRVVLEDDNA